VIVEVHAPSSIAKSSKPFAHSCDFHEESHGLRCFSPFTGLIASGANACPILAMPCLFLQPVLARLA